jgi:signal transduction histidine kinase
MQLHARLREAERWSALGAFGRHLAHELKNPLNSLLLRVSLLERESKRAAAGSDGTSNHARVIRDEATRLGRLIDDGLGTLPSRGVPSAVDLREAVRGAVAELDETLRGSRTELVSDLGPEPARVRAEPDRLRRVVQQILEDALGRVGAEPGPRVRASIVRTGDEWQFAVERTGPHFADAAELFTPGAEQSVSSTGMELAFSRRIVRALGGELAAENLSPNGARMTLTLPVARS